MHANRAVCCRTIDAEDGGGVCRARGFGLSGFSYEWVLRLSKDGRIRWIVGYKFDLNSSAAGEVAQDKVAAYAALSAAGIAAIPHYLVRSLSHELIHIHELHRELAGAAVVAKPLQGTAGRDVAWFSDVDEALNMIRSSGEPAWALSPHYDLQAEYRLIMLDGKLIQMSFSSKCSQRGRPPVQ